jgi:hypothetical protein
VISTILHTTKKNGGNVTFYPRWFFLHEAKFTLLFYFEVLNSNLPLSGHKEMTRSKENPRRQRSSGGRPPSTEHQDLLLSQAINMAPVHKKCAPLFSTNQLLMECLIYAQYHHQRDNNHRGERKHPRD